MEASRCFKPCLGQSDHIHRPPTFISAGEPSKNPLRGRTPCFSPHQVRCCTTRAAATSKCLIFSPTICNIIKSFPNHTHHLANTKIQKGQTKWTLPEVISSERNVLWCLLLKGTITFVGEITTVIICSLFWFNTEIVSITKTRGEPEPICRQQSCLLGNWAPSHLPTPTLPLSKGISEPAIWELGNSTLFLANLWMQFWH